MAVASVLLAFIDIAHAQAVGSANAAAIPDPATAPLETLSLAEKLYHSGAYLCLGILALFLGLRYASQHVAWLEVPGRAHYVSAFLGGLALVAIPASQGSTPNLSMIVVAIGTVVSLCAPGAASVPKIPQAGFARLGLLLVLVVGVVGGFVAMQSSGCGGVTPVPVSDVIDCIKLEAGVDLIALKKTLQDDINASDWKKLVSDAAAAAPGLSTVPSQGLAIASCVATELVQQYLTTKQTGGAKATTGAHVAIDQLRAKLSTPGKSVTFHTAQYGDL
jgi:hypothetical protein